MATIVFPMPPFVPNTTMNRPGVGGAEAGLGDWDVGISSFLLSILNF